MIDQTQSTGMIAMEFAKRGWPVVPLHYPLGEGQCSCRKPSCRSVGKHPMTRSGLKNASAGEATVMNWWRETPQANVGILTGEESGLVVLDVDPRHGGLESLKQIQAEHEALPPTLKVKTGGDGWHYYFKHPGKKITNKANFRPGLDIRGDGGYIVAPPSTHSCMKTYDWAEQCEVAILPPWLLSELQGNKGPSKPSKTQGGGYSEGSRNASLLSAAGFFKSKGLDQAAITNALMGLNQTICNPPLEKTEVEQIAASIGRYEEKSWGETKLLPPEAVAPEMTLDMLPTPLRRWCSDIAERMQVPLEFVGAPAIVLVASLLGRKVAVYPRKEDDWQSIPNLWGALVAPPGAMKSPALAAVLKPLQNLTIVARQEFLEETKQMEAEKSVAKIEIDSLKDGLKGALKSGNEEVVAEKKAQLAEAMKAFEENFNVTETRYLINDPTIEKLLSILQENPQGLLLYRDELGGWIETMCKSGREGDREFFLESWNGDSPYSMDRIGRGTVFVDGLCLSVLGGLQPSKFQAYVAALAKGGKNDDGLLQRFQILLFPEKRKEWKKVDRQPDTGASATVEKIFAKLAELPNPKREEDGVKRLKIRFSDEAQENVDRWREALESRLLETKMSPLLESHLSKYRSLMPSLAVIFEMIESLGISQEIPTEIGVDAADLAISWCGFLEKHAIKAYGEYIEPATVAGRRLLAKIQAGFVKDFDRIRDIYRHGWKGLSTADEMEKAVSTLKLHGWARTEMICPPTGRRSEVIRLHPSLPMN